MQEEEGTRNGRQGSSSDRRPLILVLIGVCVLLSHFIAMTTSLHPQIDQGNSGQRLVWLGQTDSVPKGLYWLDPKDLRGGREKDFLQPLHLPVQVAPILFQPIAISQADRDTLMIIPGIGSSIAEAIIHYRDREGRIEDPDTLMKIDGIGAIKAALITGYVSFDD